MTIAWRLFAVTCAATALSVVLLVLVGAREYGSACRFGRCVLCRISNQRCSFMPKGVKTRGQTEPAVNRDAGGYTS